MSGGSTSQSIIVRRAEIEGFVPPTLTTTTQCFKICVQSYNYDRARGTLTPSTLYSGYVLSQLYYVNLPM